MMTTTRFSFQGLLACAGAIFVSHFGAWGAPCIAPDNGTGTATIPAATCPLTNGTELRRRAGDLETQDSAIVLHSVKNIMVSGDIPGGNLGGNRQTAVATITVRVRNIGNTPLAKDVQVNLVTDTGPRTPGAADQHFASGLVRLEGQLPPGDPDFDFLRIEGGSDFGLPSSGASTLTRLGPPGSDFAVDSFFDIEYRIEWQGAIGGALEGLGGTERKLGTLEQPARVHEGAVYRPADYVPFLPFDPNRVRLVQLPDGLRVSNIGSSGEDGVTFGTPDSDDISSWGDSRASFSSKKGYDYYQQRHAMGPTGIVLPNPGDGVDFGFHLRTMGSRNGDEKSSCWIRVSQVAGTAELVPDWGELNATQTLVAVYDDGALVTTAVVAAGSTALTMAAPDFDAASSGCNDLVKVGNYVYLACSIGLSGDALVTPGGLPPVIGDRFVFSPLDPQVRVAGVLGATVTGTNLQPILFTGLEFGMHGQSHTALGDAVLDTPADGRDHLVISNIGSSGCDGVSIDLGPGRPTPVPATLTFTPANFQVPQAFGGGGAGGTIRVRARDSFGNALGHADYGGGGGGGGGRIVVDFSAVGDPSVRIQVLDDGAPVGEADVPAAGAQVATVTGEPLLTGCGKADGLPPWTFPCLVLTYDRDVEITPNGAPTPLVGDEVRLLSVNAPPGSFDDLRFFDFLLTDVPGIEIYSERVNGTPPPPVVLPDNGSGTADWPPVTRLGDRRVRIELKDPLGTGSLLASGGIRNYAPSGGGSGGSVWIGTLDLRIDGVGSRAGFQRDLSVPVTFEVAAGPNNFVGQDVQQFDTEMLSMEAVLPPGDPDFAFLRFSAGNAAPPPGFTPPPPTVGEATLTRLGPPGSDFQVDSFFDIEYRIEFEGTPGSPLDGMIGVTEAAHRIYFTNPPVTIFGCEHTALGGATLDASGGRLTVSNIGSSGCDGVSIDVPGGEGFAITLAPITPGAGDVLRFEGRGDWSGPAGTSFGSVQVAGTGTNYDATFDFSAIPGIAGSTLQVLDAGTLVVEVPAGPSGQVTVDAGGGGALPPIKSCGKLPGLGGPPCYVATFCDPGLITLPGLAPVIGNEIRFLASTVVPQTAGVYEFELTVTDNSGLASLVQIVDAAVGYSGSTLRGLGEVRFEPSPSPDDTRPRLTISNIGSSGCDGVSIDLEPVSPLTELEVLPSEIDLEAVGGTLRIDHIQGGAAGLSSGIRNLGGAPVVFGDASGLGVSSVTVTVVDDDHQRITFAGLPNGNLGTLRLTPFVSDFGMSRITSATKEVRYEWVHPGLQFEPAGQPPVPVRQLIITVDPAAPAPPPLERVDMTVRTLPPITFFDIRTNVVAHGLTHSSVGSSQVTLDPGGNLVVSNIGSSGCDGVSIDLGDSEGVELTPLVPIPLPGEPSDGFSIGVQPRCDNDLLCAPIVDPPMEVIVRGTGSGTADRAEVSVEKFNVTETFGPTQATRRVFGYDGNGLLTGDLLLPDLLLGDLVQIPGNAFSLAVFGFDPPEINAVAGVGPGFFLEFPDPVIFEPADGSAPFQCVRLECRCTDGFLPDQYDACVQYRETDYNFICRLTEQEGVVLQRERLYMFGGRPVEAEGAGSFDPNGGTLTISNIGSSGCDGVSIDLAGGGTGGSGGEDRLTENVTLNFTPVELDFVTLPPAGADVATARLAQFAINGNSCGTAEIDFVEVAGGGGAELRADFTDLSTGSVRVVVCDRGLCVGSYVTPNGIVGGVRQGGPVPPSLVCVGGRSTTPVPGGTDPPGYVFTFDAPVEVTPPGVGPGGGLTGDELRLLADGTPDVVPSLSRIDVTASFLPALTLETIRQRDFNTWLQENFTGLEIAALVAAGYDLDGDGDGGNAIDEFLVNGNPKLRDYGSLRPRVTAGVGGGGSLHLRHTYQRAPVSGVEVLLYRTEDLVIFDQDQAQFQLIAVTPLPNGNTELTYELITAVGDGGKNKEFIGHVTLTR